MGRLKTTKILAEEFLTGTTIEPVPQVLVSELTEKAKEMQDKFIEAMDDDFNSAKALGFLFELSHQINAFVSSADPNQAADKAVLRQAMETFSNLGGVLGIFMETATDDQQSVDNLLNIILTMRNQARQDKHYALADSLRDFLNSQEIKVEDKAGGSQFRYEKAPQIDAIMDFLVALRQDFKNTKEYNRADKLRDELKGVGITLEDTREGVRWKIVDA